MGMRYVDESYGKGNWLFGFVAYGGVVGLAFVAVLLALASLLLFKDSFAGRFVALFFSYVVVWLIFVRLHFIFEMRRTVKEISIKEGRLIGSFFGGRAFEILPEEALFVLPYKEGFLSSYYHQDHFGFLMVLKNSEVISFQRCIESRELLQEELRKIGIAKCSKY